MTGARKAYVVAGLAAVGLLGAAGADILPKRIIWNRTESAPEGLYWTVKTRPHTGDWAVVSAMATSSDWIAARGYLHDDWPIIKQVIGVAGDEICRNGDDIFKDGALIAKAKPDDYSGRPMPEWAGCITLAEDEYFLLNPHNDSLDGRYFGPISSGDVVGAATLFWRF